MKILPRLKRVFKVEKNEYDCYVTRYAEREPQVHVKPITFGYPCFECDASKATGNVLSNPCVDCDKEPRCIETSDGEELGYINEYGRWVICDPNSLWRWHPGQYYKERKVR